MKAIPLSQSGPGHALLHALWMRVREACKAVKIERRERRLRLCESLSLGDKRSIAVVEFEQKRFLVAVTSENISLLQTLEPARTQTPEIAELP